MIFTAERRQADWQNFVGAVPECASLANTNHTFECMRKANTTAILQAMSVAAAQATEEFPWIITVDGPGGLYPDLPSRFFQRGQFARLPFIAGTNLDEGKVFLLSCLDLALSIQPAFSSSNSLHSQDCQLHH